MAMLSELLPGSFFQPAGTTVPTQKYLLTKNTGTAGNMLVAYNLVQHQLVELPDDAAVTEITLTVGSQPVFTI